MTAQNAPFAVEIVAMAEPAPNAYFGTLTGIYETLDANYIYRYYIDFDTREAAENKKLDIQKLGFVNARVIDFAELQESCSIVCEYSIPKKTGKKVVPFDSKSAEHLEIEHLHAIFFDYDKSELREDAKAELDNWVLFLNQNPNHQIEILAHTDGKGGQEYNKVLATKRAESTQNYMHEKGIPKARLVIKALGKSQPIALNELPNGEDSELGRKFNRRVEFKILDNSGKFLNIVNKIKVPDAVQRH